MNNYPKIEMESATGYWDYWEAGAALALAFPDQAAGDFMAALGENASSVPAPLVGAEVVSLVMFKQGERDESEWIWGVQIASGERYVIEGWCDYTGWDCRSGITVLEVKP